MAGNSYCVYFAEKLVFCHSQIHRKHTMERGSLVFLCMARHKKCFCWSTSI